MITGESEHLYAYGCTDCTYGVRDEHYTKPTGAVELVLERLVMAERIGPSYFCDCQAGTTLRAHLVEIRKRYAAQTSRYEGQNLELGKIILADARVQMGRKHIHIEHVVPNRVKPAELP